MEHPLAQKRSLATKGQLREWLHLRSGHMLIVSQYVLYPPYATLMAPG
jgi:hypothetical protein